MVITDIMTTMAITVTVVVRGAADYKKTFFVMDDIPPAAGNLRLVFGCFLSSGDSAFYSSFHYSVGNIANNGFIKN